MFLHIKTKPVLALSLFVFLAITCKAQVKYRAKDDLNIVVSGTSSLHDWDMKTSRGESTATMVLNDNGKLTGLTALNFTVPAETLKSEHKSMDKNAYKAMKTDKNADISYTLSSASVQPDGTIKCQGKLSIAGTTIEAGLNATALVNADNSISVKGSKKISMKEFNMVPPTFMMGTIKTGNDVTVQFNLTLRK
ncbi:MAG: YceI family protein [Chitinophagaceae bacterium]